MEVTFKNQQGNEITKKISDLTDSDIELMKSEYGVSEMTNEMFLHYMFNDDCGSI